MATNYVLENDHDLAAQAESTYGTDAGTVSGTDFFKHQSGPDAIKRNIARSDRQGDRDTGSGSVITTQKGRETASVSLVMDVIPNGTTSAPTAPDSKVLMKAHFGAEHLGTAHTTTTSSSTGTTLKLTSGGGAASGVAAGDLIAVDVDSTNGYEVRRVTALATDDATVDLAFTANPASGRGVKLGDTFKFDSAVARSVTVKQFIGTSTVKKKVTGVILPDWSVECDFNSDTPVAKMTFGGVGQPLASLSDSRPSITTNGIPLNPTVGKIWIGSAKYCLSKVSLQSNNGLEVRNNEACALYPRGAKRTGNQGRRVITLTLEGFYTSGDEDTQTIYDNAASLTSYNVIVQLGNVLGKMFAFVAPKFIPDANLISQNGEFGISLTGRCYATSGDDELFAAFL